MTSAHVMACRLQNMLQKEENQNEDGIHCGISVGVPIGEGGMTMIGGMLYIGATAVGETSA